MEKLTLEELKVLESIKRSMKELDKNDLEEVIDFSKELREKKYSKSNGCIGERKGKNE